MFDFLHVPGKILDIRGLFCVTRQIPSTALIRATKFGVRRIMQQVARLGYQQVKEERCITEIAWYLDPKLFSPADPTHMSNYYNISRNSESRNVVQKE